MGHGSKSEEKGKGRKAKTAGSVLVLFPLALALAALCSCRKETAPQGGAEAVRITRYNCNIAEAHDVVDIYAEVVNQSSRGTGPLELVARVIRPEEPIVEGRTPMGRLGAGEVRHVSMRLGCKGRIALRHIALAVEPAREVQKTEEKPESLPARGG